jgi:ABC-type cobalamin/Fe3+-siderophores transport system ATPase subunit
MYGQAERRIGTYGLGERLVARIKLRGMTSPEFFRLSRVKFRAGAHPEDSGAELEPGTVTILVGPNNSGKSLALQEIEMWCRGTDGPFHVIETCEMPLPEDRTQLEEFLSDRKVEQAVMHPDQLPIRSFPISGGGSEGIAQIPLKPGLTSHPPLPFPLHCRNFVLQHFIARLDGRSRFSLADPRPATNLRQPATHHVGALFVNDTERHRVSSMTSRAFSLHFVIDSTMPSSLTMGLTETEPPLEFERAWTDEAIDFFAKNHRPLTEFSDGVQVYTGLVAAVMSLPQLLLLVDEPEAFLHPSLARTLGRDLAALTHERRATLICATHSAEFLIGCLEQVPETAIVRLTYQRGVATARVLSGESVGRLGREPLLRSTQSLRGLFVEAAVVCEADSDRVFYEEINRRLAEADDREGLPDVIFLNAQNWQTIPSIAAPLRKLGVPAAAILDLDTLTVEGEWSKFFSMLGLEEETCASLSERRSECGKLLSALGYFDGKPVAKVKGIDALSSEDAKTVADFLADLAEYGIFVAPVGELENWMKQLGLTNKQTWVVDMLRRLGSAGEAIYVEPGDGDVWEFVEDVARWARDPNRLGIP